MAKDDAVGDGDVEPSKEELENGVGPGQLFGVFDAEECLVFRGLFKGEGGIFIHHEVAQEGPGVGGNSQGPAAVCNDEVEEDSRVPAGNQDCDEGNEGEGPRRDTQEVEDDAVGYANVYEAEEGLEQEMKAGEVFGALDVQDYRGGEGWLLGTLKAPPLSGLFRDAGVRRCFANRGRGGGAEHGEGAGESVEEGGAADLAYLAVAEEAGEGGPGDAVEEDVAVVVGPSEEMFSAAQT